MMMKKLSQFNILTIISAHMINKSLNFCTFKKKEASLLNTFFKKSQKLASYTKKTQKERFKKLNLIKLIEKVISKSNPNLHEKSCRKT